MRRVHGWLVTIILFAIAIRVLWWAIEPLIPWIIVAGLLLFIFAFIFKRTTRV